MLKFLGILVLLVLVFGLGYYTGQRPVGELRKTVDDLSQFRKTVTDLSRNVVDTTVGLERNLRWRQGLINAKEQIIQAKSDLLDRNYGSAAKALGEVINNLERAREAGHDSNHARINALIVKIREARQDLASGKVVTRTRLDEIQKEVDSLSAQ